MQYVLLSIFFSCNSPKSQLGNNFFSRANSCISLGHQAWYKSQWNIWQVKGNVLTHIFTAVKSSYIDGLTNFCSSCPLQWGCRQAWQGAIQGRNGGCGREFVLSRTCCHLCSRSHVISQAKYCYSILFCSIGIACIFHNFSTPLHAGRDNLSSSLVTLIGSAQQRQ